MLVSLILPNQVSAAGWAKMQVATKTKERKNIRIFRFIRFLWLA